MGGGPTHKKTHRLGTELSQSHRPIHPMAPLLLWLATSAFSSTLPSNQMLAVGQAAAVAAGRHMLSNAGAAVQTTKLDARDLVTRVDGECQEIVESTIRSYFPGHTLLGEESVEPGWPAACAAAAALGAAEWAWIIDPIDGTTNFVSGMPLSVVSIGIANFGVPTGAVVYDPYREELFSAWAGRGATLNGSPISVSSSASLSRSVVCAPCPHSAAAMGPALRSIHAAMPLVRSVRIIGSGVLNLAWVACGRLEAYWEHELAPWDTAAGVVLVRLLFPTPPRPPAPRPAPAPHTPPTIFS